MDSRFPYPKIFCTKFANIDDEVEYLGLADLGKTVNADPGQIYQQVFLKRRAE